MGDKENELCGLVGMNQEKNLASEATVLQSTRPEGCLMLQEIFLFLQRILIKSVPDKHQRVFLIDKRATTSEI